MSPREQVAVDRFDVANASFWLDQVADWLGQGENAERLAADLWPGYPDTGPPLQVIVGQAAACLRAALRTQEQAP